MKKQSAGRRVRREKIRRKKMQVREKVGKSQNTVFFRGFVAPEGWKVGSLKQRVRRHLGRWEMKSCTPLWREAHLEVKCVKNWGVRTTFGSWDVEKVHAVVARSTFRSQNVQKHTSFGPLLEVQISKKRTPLWREAHFEVKMYKALGIRTTFGGSDLEKVHVASLRVITLHYTLHYTTVHYTTLHNTTTTELHNYTPLHSTTLNYNTLRHIALHSTTLHYITLHYTLHTLQYITLHYTPQHYNYNYRTTQLHSTTHRYTTLHYTTLHYTRKIDR